MKTQTLIFTPEGNVAVRIDDFLYQPSSTIIVNDKQYDKYNQYDEIGLDGWLVRKIELRNF
jgi:hypothetical protein